MQYYSWKTTTAGVLVILSAFVSIAIRLLHGEIPTEAEFVALAGAIVAGVGLLKARDNDKTSQEVGATQKSVERKQQELNDLVLPPPPSN